MTTRTRSSPRPRRKASPSSTRRPRFWAFRASNPVEGDPGDLAVIKGLVVDVLSCSRFEPPRRRQGGAWGLGREAGAARRLTLLRILQGGAPRLHQLHQPRRPAVGDCRRAPAGANAVRPLVPLWCRQLFGLSDVGRGSRTDSDPMRIVVCVKHVPSGRLRWILSRWPGPQRSRGAQPGRQERRRGGHARQGA